MNPYTVIRRVIAVARHILECLLYLAMFFLLGAIGATLTGQWWGWLLGPALFLTLGVVLAVIVLSSWLRRLAARTPAWWRQKERLYREKQQTAHGESNPVTS